jgi:hypothetical protein
MAARPTKLDYLRLAFQCDERAISAETKSDREHYRSQAEVWRRLARARLLHGSADAHFAPKIKGKAIREAIVAQKSGW